MVYVPAGEFVMGNTNEGMGYAKKLCNDAYKDHIARGICTWERFENELPSHSVALDAFWIDRTEVTNGQYHRCVEAGACSPLAKTGSYDDYPVVYVDWFQAVDYCAWAGGRLPTEAEWEYAARGPESRSFPWGNQFYDGLGSSDARLNYCDLSCPMGYADETVDDGYADTAPVGSYPSGAGWCGALDMAGNVREWVSDWLGPFTNAHQQNPEGPPSGTFRGLKGGGWPDAPDDVRSMNRGGHKPEVIHEKVGFRCAMNSPSRSTGQ
jgi:formylglycine-generating enzyme required for sulfatase activity